MIRIASFFVFLAAVAFGLSWVADQPGEVALTWRGQQYVVSLMLALGAVALLTAALMVVWSVLRFTFRIPAIMSIMSRARRNNKGYAAVSKGMVAAAIGDVKTTEKAAREATKHLGIVPLTTLLQAQAAQISGDRDRAVLTFNQMMENPETRVLGLRGLYLEAHRNGDSAAAQAFAKEAYAQSPMPWAGQALLEHHAMADDWSGALSVVESSIARKAIDKKIGNRQRGVLKTAIAMDLAGREPDEALRIAREAMKLAPDLIPAYVIVGKLLARRGDIRRAARIVENGWRVMPHPDLARVYLDLRPGDSATERLSRAGTLTKVYAEHRESRLTLARAALEARDFGLARKTIEQLLSSDAKPTVRTCLLMADLEETEHGPTGQVREWLARATRAARDPMWVADGIVTDTWAPASPVTGKLDAFVWDVPIERIAAPVEPDKPSDGPKVVDVLAPPIVPAATSGSAASSAAQIIVTGASVARAADLAPTQASSSAQDAETGATGKSKAAAKSNAEANAKAGAEDKNEAEGKVAASKPAAARIEAATGAAAAKAKTASPALAAERQSAAAADGKTIELKLVAPADATSKAAASANGKAAGKPVSAALPPGDVKETAIQSVSKPVQAGKANKVEKSGETKADPADVLARLPDDPGPRKQNEEL